MTVNEIADSAEGGYLCMDFTLGTSLISEEKVSLVSIVPPSNLSSSIICVLVDSR